MERQSDQPNNPKTKYFKVIYKPDHGVDGGDQRMSATVEDEQDVAVQYRPHHSKGRQKGPHVVKLVLTPQFFVLSRNIAIAFIILKIKWIWLARSQSLENTNTLSLRQERLRVRVYPTVRVESDLVRSTRRSSRIQHLLSMSATH